MTNEHCPEGAKRKAMYAIDPVQKASRRYMVPSGKILPRTLVRFTVSFAAENQSHVLTTTHLINGLPQCCRSCQCAFPL